MLNPFCHRQVGHAGAAGAADPARRTGTNASRSPPVRPRRPAPSGAAPPRAGRADACAAGENARAADAGNGITAPSLRGTGRGTLPRALDVGPGGWRPGPATLGQREESV